MTLAHPCPRLISSRTAWRADREGIPSRLQADGSLAPPINPKWKAVLIATPNFGRLGNTGRCSEPEMYPGSAFLWNLASWNQGHDDLPGHRRPGYRRNAGGQNSSDVSCRSPVHPSIYRDPSTNQGSSILPLFLFSFLCSGRWNSGCGPIIRRPVRSFSRFLAGTSGWMSIGARPVGTSTVSIWGRVLRSGASHSPYLNTI